MTLDEWFDNHKIIRDSFGDYYVRWKETFTTVVRINPILNNLYYNIPTREWLKENVGEENIKWMFVGLGFWMFATEKDATLFKLVWG